MSSCPLTSSLEQKANEHVFGGGRMQGRSVSSQRLARVWMVLFFIAHGEETRGVFPFKEASSGFFCMLTSLPGEARW